MLPSVMLRLCNLLTDRLISLVGNTAPTHPLSPAITSQNASYQNCLTIKQSWKVNMFPGVFASDTSSFNNGAYHVNAHKTNTYYACEVLSEVQVRYAVQKRQLKLTVHQCMRAILTCAVGAVLAGGCFDWILSHLTLALLHVVRQL